MQWHGQPFYQSRSWEPTGSADSNWCISDEHFFMIKWHSNQNKIITSRHIFLTFLSEVMEAKWGWWNKDWMFYIKSPYLRIPKIIGFWLKCHWIMKKCSSEMHQFESADPVLAPFFFTNNKITSFWFNKHCKFP